MVLSIISAKAVTVVVAASLVAVPYASFKQQDAPLNVRCGQVSGEMLDSATWTRWGREAGEWLHGIVKDPATYRSESNIKRNLYGMRDMMARPFAAFYLAANGDNQDPELAALEAEAEKRASAAEDACTPCPTSSDGTSDPDYDPKTLAMSVGSATAKGEKAVWQALRAAGFSPVHAAGVMGNMKVESGFDPLIVQGGGHSTNPASTRNGYGLVQWTPGRKLKDYIGKAKPTVANEVAALKAQLAGKGPHSEKAAGDAFWAAKDVSTAAETFHLRYERSASRNSSQRVRYALSIYSQWKGTGGGTASVLPPTTEPEVQCLTSDQESKGTVLASIAGTRRIKEPTSGVTYQIPIPAGPRGVAINFALDQVAAGKWYRFGSHGPDTWDCSGLVSAAWAKAGVKFTPQTEAMLRQIPKTSTPKPGDLTYKYGHTQMILGRVGGENLIVEAPRTGSRMRIRPQWMHVTYVLDPTKIREQP